MAQLPASIERTVKQVLREYQKKGRGSRTEIRLAVSSRIPRNNGQLPAAAIECGFQYILGQAIDREMRRGLPENVIGALVAKSPNMPKDLRAVLGRIPSWFAIEEGLNADRVWAMTANPDDWFASWRLKERKGRQTLKKADVDLDMGRLLQSLGAANLSELIGVEAS